MAGPVLRAKYLYVTESIWGFHKFNTAYPTWQTKYLVLLYLNLEVSNITDSKSAFRLDHYNVFNILFHFI